MTYSQFMAGLRSAGIALDRKSLAEIAATDAAAFSKLVESAKAARASA
jgi:large subunit ribosomal protein L20